MRNFSFFIAARPALITPSAYIMSLSFYVLPDILADPDSAPCLPSTMFCMPLSVHSDIVLCVVITYLQLFPKKWKNDGCTTREMNSVSHFSSYTKNWEYKSYCPIMLTQKSDFDSLQCFSCPFWKAVIQSPCFVSYSQQVGWGWIEVVRFVIV